MYREDYLHAGFTKHVLDIILKDGSLCRTATHHFTSVEPQDALPHNHPFDIVSNVRYGSYIEEVYHVLAGGGWWMEVIKHNSGDEIIIPANTIHRLIELPDSECVTQVIQGEPYQDWGHFQFDKRGVFFRKHGETEFKPYKP